MTGLCNTHIGRDYMEALQTLIAIYGPKATLGQVLASINNNDQYQYDPEPRD